MVKDLANVLAAFVNPHDCFHVCSEGHLSQTHLSIPYEKVLLTREMISIHEPLNTSKTSLMDYTCKLHSQLLKSLLKAAKDIQTDNGKSFLVFVSSYIFNCLDQLCF